MSVWQKGTLRMITKARPAIHRYHLHKTTKGITKPSAYKWSLHHISRVSIGVSTLDSTRLLYCASGNIGFIYWVTSGQLQIFAQIRNVFFFASVCRRRAMMNKYIWSLIRVKYDRSVQTNVIYIRIFAWNGDMMDDLVVDAKQWGTLRGVLVYGVRETWEINYYWRPRRTPNACNECTERGSLDKWV